VNIGKFASCIRQAKTVYAWVPYHRDDGVYIQIPKTSARLILEDARETEMVEIHADMRGGADLYIG
jgi:hypothetical protein